ncbi:MAG TPA: ABC transporter ATP-binding protein [Rhodopirellula baltica]|uniref:ABC-type multidrug transport system, ATPase component n=1 Tax=Rhodopirellula baltica (strain DSM 10527 / NCIMB 13988 / SH1) TaxID=243090 RepID=Q7UXH4_RHOBA|nr:ABC transporter ATP-binding protein [Rhodopirellula baltica]CAD72032.1 ABC-type multidrug transport system, ATPase component [Rhodopirellula baltica SH 1]HBE66383.1 ABC transporter ATP-binding protein [Rhodopirellula baltica]
MIELTHLQKLYDDTIAVKDVTVSIPAGVICGLVGPNGAGKTTTLRCMAGLLPATAGEIRINGFSPDSDPVRHKRTIAYVPDDPPLFDDLTVGEHLDFVARLYQIEDHRRTAIDLLERFELLGKYDAMVTSLSRGMRQKLAVACAYLIQPQVLLLDEPLTGLDPPGIRVLLQSVREFVRSGRTAIVSSHLLAMIGDVCDQVWLLQNGLVRYHGTTTGLRQEFPETNSLEEAFFAAMKPVVKSDAGIDESTVVMPGVPNLEPTSMGAPLDQVTANSVASTVTNIS